MLLVRMNGWSIREGKDVERVPSLERACIKIEFTGGAYIDDCYTEALRLAKLLQVNIDFTFNELFCSVGPGGKNFQYLIPKTEGK